MDRIGSPLFARWPGMVAVLVSAFLLAPTILQPAPAAAEGALAVGLPSDVAESGFAYGIAVNYSTRDEAARKALESCRATKVQEAGSLCSLVKTFHGQCAAVAMDPQDGTPGVGWAISIDKQEAEIKALAGCIATAGASRREFCKVTGSMCDTE